MLKRVFEEALSLRNRKSWHSMGESDWLKRARSPSLTHPQLRNHEDSPRLRMNTENPDHRLSLIQSGPLKKTTPLHDHKRLFDTMNVDYLKAGRR